MVFYLRRNWMHLPPNKWRCFSLSAAGRTSVFFWPVHKPSASPLKKQLKQAVVMEMQILTAPGWRAESNRVKPGRQMWWKKGRKRNRVPGECSVQWELTRVCILRRPHLKTNYVTMLREGSSKCSPQMPSPFPSFWRTHRYYSLWPHISQDSLRQRKGENGDIAWRRSSLSRAWAAEIVM